MSLRKVVLVVNSLKGHSASVSGNSADICSAPASSLAKFEIKASPARALFTPQLGASQSVFPLACDFIISASRKKLCGVTFCSFHQNQMETDDLCLQKFKEDLTKSSFQSTLALQLKRKENICGLMGGKGSTCE